MLLAKEDRSWPRMRRSLTYEESPSSEKCDTDNRSYWYIKSVCWSLKTGFQRNVHSKLSEKKNNAAELDVVLCTHHTTGNKRKERKEEAETISC